MAEITLRKYHGLGNDYLIYDPNRNACELQERQVEALCRRNLGVGADGILYGPFFDGDKMRVRIFNPDGSEAEKSGNGIRIFSKYLKDMGYVTEESYVLHRELITRKNTRSGAIPRRAPTNRSPRMEITDA